MMLHLFHYAPMLVMSPTSHQYHKILTYGVFRVCVPMPLCHYLARVTQELGDHKKMPREAT